MANLLFGTNWITLRKKITGLALIPALVCCLIFGLLIWVTSGSTAGLVGEELTRFMAERTSRACIHGYNTSIVTYGYVIDALNANMETVRLLLAKDGGVHLLPGRKVVWQAVNEETNEGSAVSAPTIGIGSWQAGPMTDRVRYARSATRLGGRRCCSNA